MAHRKKRRSSSRKSNAPHSPFASRDARIAELEQKCQELETENRVLVQARDEIAKRYDFERGKTSADVVDANTQAKSWMEQAKRFETVMHQRVEEAGKDDERKQREIRFLRDALYRIASGDQVEQTFRVLG